MDGSLGISTVCEGLMRPHWGLLAYRSQQYTFALLHIMLLYALPVPYHCEFPIMCNMTALIMVMHGSHSVEHNTSI